MYPPTPPLNRLTKVLNPVTRGLDDNQVINVLEAHCPDLLLELQLAERISSGGCSLRDLVRDGHIGSKAEFDRRIEKIKNCLRRCKGTVFHQDVTTNGQA